MVLYDKLVAENRRILARALASLHRDHFGRLERASSLSGERGTTDRRRRTEQEAPLREPGHDVSPRGNVMRAYATHAAINVEQCGARPPTRWHRTRHTDHQHARASTSFGILSCPSRNQIYDYFFSVLFNTRAAERDAEECRGDDSKKDFNSDVHLTCSATYSAPSTARMDLN